MRKSKITLLLSLAILLLLLGLSGCSETNPRSLKPSADWSRGVQIGETAAGSLGMAVDGDGERVHLVWPNIQDNGTILHYAQLSSMGEIVQSHDLDLPTGWLITPRLLPAGQGRLHLFWSHRAGNQAIWELRHALLSSEGELASDINTISITGFGVDDFGLASDYQGGAYITWTGSKDGLYVTHLQANGDEDGNKNRVADQGENPTVAVSMDGDGHLVWVDENRILYARLAVDQLDPPRGERIAEINIGSANTFYGPTIGLSMDQVYVLWSVAYQSGTSAGEARTSYVHFPLGEPVYLPQERVFMWPQEKQEVANYESEYTLTQLSPPAPAEASSSYIHQPSTAPGQRDEVAAAVSVYQELRRGNESQLAVAIFADGAFIGYEMAGKTTNTSEEPVLLADSAGNLHLAWREAAAGRKIYYATTAPNARANLDQLTPGDVTNALMTGIMESFIGMLFLPWFGFGWLLPGGILVIAWKIYRDHDSLNEDIPSRVILVIAFLIFQFIKLLSMPGILTYVPFSAWIPIPDNLQLILLLGVPFFIFAISILVAEIVRRRRSSSALAYYFAMVGTDTLLSLAIYGVTFLGVS